ncbi:MAG: DUF5069 domain-containing protein [Chthoniobacterales bacterium]
MNPANLRALAPDLNQTAPRSPRAALGEHFPAVAARAVDKCRAELVGQSGSYHYDCPMDRRFFAATGLNAGELREFVATGASDAEVAGWMSAHATMPREKIAGWSLRFRANPLWRLLDLEDWLHQRRASRS